MNRLAALWALLAGPALAADFDATAVKSACDAEWPDDFQMVEFCLRQRTEGHAEFAGLRDAAAPGMQPALAACADEWGQQWEMVAFCARQRLEAARTLPDHTAGIPEEVAATITGKCRADWGDQWEMVAFCVEQQADSWRRLNP